MIKLITILSMLFAGMAYADVAPPQASDAVGAFGTSLLGNGCKKVRMCAGQTATGDCTSGGDEIVARVASHVHLTFYSNQSTASAWICDIVSNDQGHDAASGSGTTINASSITDANPVLSITGLFDFLWITCPTLADNLVTITMLSCPVAR